MKEVACAMREFRVHMEEMMEEKSRLVEGIEEARKNNLLSVLLRLRDGSERDGLSNEEILGNLFTYNIAGHDTISNTLTYCLYLISVQPEIQEWIREETQHVLGSDSNVEDWEYEEAFPRLKRCLALMVG
jgi:cytochrome P450